MSKQDLLQTLEARFESNMHRHEKLRWADVAARIGSNAKALKAIQRMESSGGEPDVVIWDDAAGALRFCDCSKQSPTGRRSVCYDAEARQSRKKHAPENSALELAAEIGIELLTEAQYRQLQELDDFDTTTSSWIATPPAIRALGGALFCDRRFGKVFVYHNGADSYYGARGFRGSFQV